MTASFTAEISISFVELKSEKLDLCLNYSKSRANLSCGKNRNKIRKKRCNVINIIELGNIKLFQPELGCFFTSNLHH